MGSKVLKRRRLRGKTIELRPDGMPINPADWFQYLPEVVVHPLEYAQVGLGKHIMLYQGDEWNREE